MWPYGSSQFDQKSLIRCHLINLIPDDIIKIQLYTLGTQLSLYALKYLSCKEQFHHLKRLGNPCRALAIPSSREMNSNFCPIASQVPLQSNCVHFGLGAAELLLPELLIALFSITIWEIFISFDWRLNRSYLVHP